MIFDPREQKLPSQYADIVRHDRSEGEASSLAMIEICGDRRPVGGNVGEISDSQGFAGFFDVLFGMGAIGFETGGSK